MSAKTRIISNFKIYGANLATGAGGVTTANVAESGNLYFTEARARQSISVTGSGSYDNTTGIITITGGGGGGNVDSVAGATGVISNVQLAAGIQSTGIFNTSNVVEGSNLYFTNARVYSNVTQLGYITSDALSGYATNSQLSVYATNSQLDLYVLDTDLTTANVTELNNLYFTNARVYSNVIELNYATTSLVNTKANIADLTTANVAELNNLYFTNARVYSNVIQLGYITNTALNGYATNIQLSVYATNSQLDLYVLDTDLTTANVTELNNLYFTNARVYSNVIQLNYATTSLVNTKANIADLTTANVAELNNLYFTNARVYSNVIQLGYITNTALNGYATNNQLTLYATTANLDLKANITDLTTANVIEGANLYFTNARVYSNVSPLLANKADLSGATFTGNVIVTNLLPPSDDSGVVGDASRTWNNGHFTNLSVDTLGSISGTLNVRTALDLGTDDPLRLGDNDDIEIYHDGTNSYIDLNSGNLVFRDVISNRATFVRHTGDFVLSTGNSQANYFIGDGSPLTNVRVANTNITGNIISSQITSIANSQITGNIISSKLEPTGVSASTYGGAATSTVFVVDQQGRLTSASNALISIPSSALNTDVVLGTQTSGAYVANLVAGTGVILSGLGNEGSTPTISIGQAVSTASDVTFRDITATGNLLVSGTVTTINTEEINLADNQIVLNSNHSGAPTQDAGFIVNRGSSANVSLYWDETNDRWTVNNSAAAYIIHNTGRDVVLGTETSGAYVANLVQGSGISLSGLGNEGTTPTIALGTSGVSAATYGNATIIPIVTIDTFGRITSASNVIVNVANSNVQGNTISSKLEPTGVTASTYGGAATSTVLVIDQQGRITSASNVTSTVANTNITGNIISTQITSVANSQITGNTISSKLEPTGVTASTYGGAATSTVLVIDQQGRITSASNVAINTAITLTDQTSTATTQYLLLNAASSGSQSTANVSTTKLYFTPSTGELSATAYNSLSDKRYKKEIRNIEDPINLLNQTRGVTFKWKETGTPAIGVIAQEIEKVLPFAVSSNEQGILSVRYSDIIGLMIEAIKEQQKQINTLKQQIEKLNG